MKNKCKKCESYWEVRDDMAYKMDKCPFCGASLIEDMTIGDYLRRLVCESGVDVLRDGNKINALLADYFPKNEKERRTIKIAYEYGIGKIFCEIYAADSGKEGEYVERLRSILSEEAWLAKNAIEYVCGMFFYAIGSEYAVTATDAGDIGDISHLPSDIRKDTKMADGIYGDAEDVEGSRDGRDESIPGQVADIGIEKTVLDSGKNTNTINVSNGSPSKHMHIAEEFYKRVKKTATKEINCPKKYRNKYMRTGRG